MCNDKNHPPQVFHLPNLEDSLSPSPSPPPPSAKNTPTVKRRSPSLPPPGPTPQIRSPLKHEHIHKKRIEIPIEKRIEVPNVKETHHFHIHHHWHHHWRIETKSATSTCNKFIKPTPFVKNKEIIRKKTKSVGKTAFHHVDECETALQLNDIWHKEPFYWDSVHFHYDNPFLLNFNDHFRLFERNWFNTSCLVDDCFNSYRNYLRRDFNLTSFLDDDYFQLFRHHVRSHFLC